MPVHELWTVKHRPFCILQLLPRQQKLAEKIGTRAVHMLGGLLGSCRISNSYVQKHQSELTMTVHDLTCSPTATVHVAHFVFSTKGQRSCARIQACVILNPMHHAQYKPLAGIKWEPAWLFYRKHRFSHFGSTDNYLQHRQLLADGQTCGNCHSHGS